MTAAEHRERAQLLRQQAIQLVDARARQQLMLVAIEHEAIAEELDRLDAEDEAG